MFSSLSWGQSQFDEAVEKATSELRLAEEDIALNLEICDQIRSKAVPPKDAVRALRRRLTHRNPNVQLLALGLTDVCVKNGGDHFLAEVAGREFMDNLVSLLHAFDSNPEVRARILRLVQNWAIAFEGKPNLAYVNHVYKDLSSRGFEFPPKDLVLANAAMVDTSTAPEWIDSDVCMHCRTAFSFTNRKHHCRNCGQVFDQACSARSLPLPHFGITQEVRVCNPCHTKLSSRRDKKERSQSVDFYAGTGTGHHHRASRSHSHRHHRDPDLERAIQLSLAESSADASSRRETWHSSEPPLVRTIPTDDDDAELRAAIEASLAEARAPRPSAPQPELETYPNAPPPLPVLPAHDLHPREEDAILTFTQTVHDAPGTDLARVHALYDHASGLRPKLALSLDDTGRKEQMLGEMHEKLSHAVKLYDELLTGQLARPRRSHTFGAQSWAQPQGAQVQRHALQGPYRVDPQRVEEYQSLSSEPYQQHPITQSPSHLYQQQSSLPQQSKPYQQHQPEVYHPPLQPQQSQPYQGQPFQQQPSEAYQQPHDAYQVHPTQQQSQTYQSSEPHQQQQQPALGLPTPSYPQQTWSRPQQEQHQQSSVPASMQQPPPTPAQTHEPPTPSQDYQQYYAPPPPVTVPPSQSASVSLAQPQYIAQSPPAQPQYAGQSPSAPAQSQFAAQSSPIAAAAAATHSYFQQRMHSPATHSPPPPQTYQPVHSPPPAQSHYVSRNMFPTAPTSNPQAFPLYGPGPPAGLEQTEKKEVALIDL